MLKPTNDPLQVMKRSISDSDRARRDAARAGGTQPFQTTRKMQQQIDDLRELVLRLPTNEGRQVSESGFSLNGSTQPWRTIASVSIPRPAQMTRVVVQASAAVSAIAPGFPVGFDTRLIINGTESSVMVAVVESGSNQYARGSAYPTFVREISGLAGSVNVQLQGRGFTWDAFPEQNTANLSVMAGFTTV